MSRLLGQFRSSSHTTQPGTVCVALAGEIDMTVEDAMSHALTAALLDPQVNQLDGI